MSDFHLSLPFSYEDLDGKFTALPLYHFELLCWALEIFESRLLIEPGCIDAKSDPELAEAYESLSVAVVCHPHWHDKFSTANQVRQAVRARYLGTRQRAIPATCHG